MSTVAESAKSRAAVAAAALVVDGMIVGLGSGSTAAFLVRRLGERIKQEGLRITAVSTSDETTRLATASVYRVQELDSGLGAGHQSRRRRRDRSANSG